VAEFLDTAVSFPAAVFGILLVIVIGYWLVVLLGVIGEGLLDADAGDSDVGFAGFLGALGLGGVPVAAVLSLWIAFGWFGSFIGVAFLDDADGLDRIADPLANAGVLVLAIIAGYVVTYLVVIPLRRLMPEPAPPPQRSDLVGRTCVVRTTTVDHEHGQAEVAAEDGSSAVIQVRQTGGEPLHAGSAALIFDYDADGEFFWITVAPSP
jgi:hypothetical protein